MARFEIEDTPIAGLKVVQRRALADARGFLSRVFCAQELQAAGWRKPVAQINHTLTSRAGTVRGLHYQRPPHAEMKLVACLQGCVWDVALDLRRGSPTFLRWHATELSPENGRALLIPEGLAHGFQTLTDGCMLLYLHSAPHEPRAEAGLNPADGRLAIAWPRALGALSERDAALPLLDEGFEGLTP
jgi:dTDP-4-dehydrorhamnose 3,5-epimerase